jgi:hypothetical protein
MRPMLLDVLLNGAKEFEVGMAFTVQSNAETMSEKLFLIDDFSIIGERPPRKN